MRQHPRARGRHHLRIARGVIEVLVRVEHLRDREALPARRIETLAGIERIDDQRLSSLRAGNQVLEIPEVVGGPDSFDQHAFPYARSASSNNPCCDLSGTRMRTVVPSPTTEWMSMFPPMSLSRSRMLNNPNPPWRVGSRLMLCTSKPTPGSSTSSVSWSWLTARRTVARF